MRVKTVTIPISDPASGEEELNSFLRSHSILDVDIRFVPDGSNSMWCICVRYLENVKGSKAERGKVDYRDLLGQDEFKMFCALRKKRKAIALEDGIPAYAVFTDNELADLSRLDDLNAANALRIKGIGKARVEKYIDRLIAIDTDLENPDGVRQEDEKGEEPLQNDNDKR